LVPPEVEVEGDYVFTGTLGCIVRDNGSGDMMMLSNFHVMCVDNTWAAGDTMAQPSLVDTGTCPADIVGTLTRAELNQDVDAAVATITARGNACEIVDIGDIEGSAEAAIDMQVRKRGRTTGLTNGRVTSIDYSTNVDYGDGLGVVTLKNQIRIVNESPSTFFGKKGDSGSVVVNEDNEVVGLYFAGNVSGTVGVANSIAAVLSALNVSLCTGRIKKLELKEDLKEFIPEKWLFKDWKEWAYEKFYSFEHDIPWDIGRPPVRSLVRPPVGSRGAAGMQARAQGRPQSLEERLARIEAMLSLPPWWPPPLRPTCVDFASMPPGPGPNPLATGFAFIHAFDFMGNPLPQTQITTIGAHTGLDCGWHLDIRLRPGCPTVQLTVVHTAQPVEVEAWNAGGTPAGIVISSPVQFQPQTLTISGTSIVFVRLHARQSEALLVRLCCCEDVTCKSRLEDKPYLADHKAVIKDKEKELIKEPKEVKEGKEPKEVKEDLKELRESGPGGPQPPGPQSFGHESSATGGSLEARLARLEAQLGGQGHFIASHLRPDLSRGALHGESDVQAGGMPYHG
jgi:hypothetical protein